MYAAFYLTLVTSVFADSLFISLFFFRFNHLEENFLSNYLIGEWKQWMGRWRKDAPDFTRVFTKSGPEF